tara:strand:- start:512 stop:796 length:285 start_codon:yes stop_codon:yes gene_type:complete
MVLLWWRLVVNGITSEKRRHTMPQLTRIKLQAMLDPTRAREQIITAAYQSCGNMREMASKLGASVPSLYRICGDLDMLPEIKKIRCQAREVVSG